MSTPWAPQPHPPPRGDAAELLSLLAAMGQLAQGGRGGADAAGGAGAQTALSSAPSAFLAYQPGPQADGPALLSALQFWSEVRACPAQAGTRPGGHSPLAPAPSPDLAGRWQLALPRKGGRGAHSIWGAAPPSCGRARPDCPAGVTPRAPPPRSPLSCPFPPCCSCTRSR